MTPNEMGSITKKSGQVVSVVICAYTEARWEALAASIASVENQTVPALEIVLVIDHNPVLLERVRAAYPKMLLPKLTIIENSQGRGISGGRNSGVLASSGAIVAFLDDDAVAYPDWLEQMTTSYVHSRVMGVGGAIEPKWAAEQPAWFPDEFHWVVGCTYRGMPQTVTPVRNLIGASMSFRREVFEEVGYFQEGLGHVGKRTLGCEETELSIRIHQHWPDAQLMYNPQMRVRHEVPSQRTRWNYFRQRCYNEGLSKAIVARSVGSKDGLASERQYTLRVLPAGVIRGVRDGVERRDISGLRRAGAITTGLAFTTAGYLVGTVGERLAARRANRKQKVYVVTRQEEVAVPSAGV